MDFQTEYGMRHGQVAILHEHCFNRYAQLESQYEMKNLEVIEYKQKSHYWETQFKPLKSNEELLKQEIEDLKAQLRKREQQLFGRKSEKDTKQQDQSNLSLSNKQTKKNRGQQPGSKGHGRRDYGHLPVVEETVSLMEKDSYCPCCHLPYDELPGGDVSEILEIINVRGYRRNITRKKYKRRCVCKANVDPQIISAPISERLIPKSKIGISIWALLLIKKFEYQQPIYRSLEELSGYGLPLAMGTVTDGLQKLVAYFVPVYDAIIERSVAAKHWHADETGWKVFETVEGKKSHRWFLWIFHNEDTVVYKMHPTRSSEVLIEYFGKKHTGGTLNVDRYSAYKVIAKSGLFVLAFCWAHVRRDFLEYAKGYVTQEAWALAWVDRIGKLYHINNQRIQYQKKSKPFRQHDQQLRNAILNMRNEINKQLLNKDIMPSAKKLLTSLDKHWDGLIVFVDSPDIPMDNNIAERGLRGSVLGRKNYYGSGAVWSAELASAVLICPEFSRH